MSTTRFTFLIFCVLNTLLSIAQNKQDYVWVFGHNSTLDPGIESYIFDFKMKGNIPEELIGNPIYISGNNASISEGDGNLLFYTNGCYVVDSTFQVMPNGSGLNAGAWLNETQGPDCERGYRGNRNALVLPDPNNENGYYIFHKTIELDPLTFETFRDNLKYSYVDMTLNNGKGDVTDKNIFIIDSLMIHSNYTTAIKHQNGMGWWIIQPVEQTNHYLKILLNSDEVSVVDTIKIGPVFHRNASAAGTARFSPDGLKYAYFNQYENLLLYDLDRSSGNLSNLKRLKIKDTNDILFTNIEFSPNSRFLYVTAIDSLWQVDLWEDNLEDGLALIDVWDGNLDPFPNTFYQMQLAPDCKIYMCSPSGNKSYHVINKPNEKGTACDFVQQGIKLPHFAASASLPHFPNFRIDDDAVCDPTITSIFGDQVYYRKDLEIYPNPVVDYVTVRLAENSKGTIIVYDMQGNMVLTEELSGQIDDIKIDLSMIASGTYSVEFLPEDNKERLVYTSQIIKVY